MSGKRSEWFKEEIHGNDVWKRKGSFGRYCTQYDSAHELELHHNYNGGGPQAFGGAGSWPVITLKVAFNEGEYEQQKALAKRLMEVVDDFFAAEL